LKPDCFPYTDGGRIGSAASRARKRTMQFSENDQAKPDLFSRLACSTLLSKILESLPPERRPFGSRPGCYTRLSSNLLRSPVRFQSSSPVFLREPFKHIELCRLCQRLISFFRPRPFQLTVGGMFLACEFNQPDRNKFRSKESHCAKYLRSASAPRLSR
jgi:hypothetical protein